MRRLRTDVEKEVYRPLRREAFARGVSMAELVWRIVRGHLEVGGEGASRTSLRFVGTGHSVQGRLAAVSERHDEALREA